MLLERGRGSNIPALVLIVIIIVVTIVIDTVVLMTVILAASKEALALHNPGQANQYLSCLLSTGGYLFLQANDS